MPTIASTTKAANANTVSRSPTLAMALVLVVAAEIGKEIEGARDQNGPAAAGATKGAVRIWVGFDTVEVRFGAAGQFLLVESSGVGRASCDQGTPDPAEPLEHGRNILVGEERGDHDPVPLGKAFAQPVEPRRVVRAVPQLLGIAPFEPARERDVDVVLDRPAAEGCGSFARAAVTELMPGNAPGPLGLAEPHDRAGLRHG